MVSPFQMKRPTVKKINPISTSTASMMVSLGHSVHCEPPQVLDPVLDTETALKMSYLLQLIFDVMNFSGVSVDSDWEQVRCLHKRKSKRAPASI